MTDMTMLWLDDPRVGCGWRPYVVLRVGRKRVHVFQPASLTHLDLPIEQFEKARGEPLPTTKLVAKRCIRQIKCRLKINKALGLKSPASYAKEAITVLENI